MKNLNGNSKMKLAVLILAHKNLEQLIRLCSNLLHDDIDLFIHIDKKWNLSEDEYTRLINLNKEKIYITDNRISASIYLWSLVEATMELIQKSKHIEKEKGITYKYFALLSGQDYPIKPLDYIINLLKNSYPKPFIDCTPYHPKNWLKSKFNTLPLENRVLLYFINHWKPGKIRRLKNILIKIPIYSYFTFKKIFISTPIKKLRKIECALYGGSAWWILPDVAVNNILDRYMDSEDKVVEYLSQTLSPEETFFQIMVMQTTVASLVETNPPLDINQNCLTYAHFRDEKKPFTGHPYILNNKDFNKIKVLPHLFARKFDESLDIDILNQIDSDILHKSYMLI